MNFKKFAKHWMFEKFEKTRGIKELERDLIAFASDETFLESIGEDKPLSASKIKSILDESINSLKRTKSRRKFIKLGLLGLGAIGAQKLSKPAYDYFTKGSGQVRLNSFRLSNKIQKMINNREFPNMNNSIDPNLWASTINEAYSAVTGRNIESNPEYQNIVLTLIYAETGFRTVKKLLSWLSVPEFSGDSKGAMQVKNPNANTNLRDTLLISIRHLESVILIYTRPEKIDERRLPFIFADWNAGAYSCKAAGIQTILNQIVIPSPNLEIDGDFGVLSKNAMKKLNRDNRLNMDENEIDKASKRNPESIFRSRFYQILLQKYPQIEHPVVADAKVLGLLNKLRATLSSEPLSSKKYSNSALLIYQKIKNL